MNKSMSGVFAVLLVLAADVAAAGAEVDFNAADLTRIAKDQVKVLKVGAIPWIADGKAALPIVCGGTSE